MDDDTRQFELFLEVYGTLPRAGPGGDEHTIRALELVPGPTPATVLDLGCGPGAQTLALASTLPETTIVAVDLLPSMVAEAARRVSAAGFDDRVTVVEGDMSDPPVGPDGSDRPDLIWCEGAIYIPGVTEALDRWRSLLGHGGSVAFTEPVWLVDSPPAELVDWWTADYPAISDRAGVVARIEAASYRTIGSFVLPASAWWDEYYAPMTERLAALRERLPDDPLAAEVADRAEVEIDMFRRFSDYYSYEFFIVQPTG